MPPFGELPIDGVVGMFRTALDRWMGFDPTLRRASGSTLTAPDSLAGSGLVIVTAAERHRVVWCDPALRARVAGVVDPRSAPEPEQITAGVRDLGGTLVGRSVLHVLHRRGLRDPGLPEGASVLDDDLAAVGPQIDELRGAATAREIDEGGFGHDERSARVTVVTDPVGEVVSGVVRRAARMSATFVDLGVLTHPGRREEGWGSGALAAAARTVFDAGALPLYRCEAGNETSLSLGLRLGFRRAAELDVVRFA